jgi:type II secretory pathway component PulC
MRTILRKLAFPTAFALATAAALLSIAHLAAPAECPPEPASPPTVVEVIAAPVAIVPAADSKIEGVRCLAGQPCVVSRAALAELFDNPGRLEEQARIMPSIKDGVVRGFKVYGLRPASILKEIGMKNGDLIVALDGVALNSMEAGLAAVMRLRDAAAVDLDLSRKGQSMRLRVAFE